MDRVWGTIRKDHKITASFDMECPPFFWKREDTLVAVLEVLCLRLEAPHPVWLNKHTREMDRFGFTRFFSDDFIESIYFDALELEYISEKAENTP